MQAYELVRTENENPRVSDDPYKSQLTGKHVGPTLYPNQKYFRKDEYKESIAKQ